MTYCGHGLKGMSLNDTASCFTLFKSGIFDAKAVWIPIWADPMMKGLVDR